MICDCDTAIYCNFCQKGLQFRSYDCQSLAICVCDRVGHKASEKGERVRTRAEKVEKTL